MLNLAVFKVSLDLAYDLIVLSEIDPFGPGMLTYAVKSVMVDG